jgi:hypothetical protein
MTRATDVNSENDQFLCFQLLLTKGSTLPVGVPVKFNNSQTSNESVVGDPTANSELWRQRTLDSPRVRRPYQHSGIHFSSAALRQITFSQITEWHALSIVKESTLW